MPEAFSPLRSPVSPKGLLQNLMAAFERETGLRMSFDDFTGYFGAHRDVPTMDLDHQHQVHTGPFCVHAGSDPECGRDCIRNKIAANWAVMRRGEGLHGLCHLGVFEIAEPLLFHGEVLGVFYFGSAVLRGSEAEAERRIRRYCRLRGKDPGGYLEKLAELPLIEESEIPRLREIVLSIAQLGQFLYEAGGIRPEMYPKRPLRIPYQDPEAMPMVVKETLRHIGAHLAEPFIVKDLAARLRCHPDFLSRKFKQHIGVNLSLYLQKVRVERARKLLENPKLSIDDAAERSGFSDRIHFSKVFRRITGKAPGEYRRQLPAREPQAAATGWREGDPSR